jgi:hypothetical protein
MKTDKGGKEKDTVYRERIRHIKGLKKRWKRQERDI